MNADLLNPSVKIPSGDTDFRVRVGLALAEMAIDRILETNRRKFEQSLVDNECPSEHLADMLEGQHERAQEWRERTLADIRAKLLASDELFSNDQ